METKTPMETKNTALTETQSAQYGESVASWITLVAGIKADPQSASVIELVEQIKTGFAPSHAPAILGQKSTGDQFEAIPLVGFTSLYSDHHGLESLSESDTVSVWNTWRNAYCESLASQIIPHWQQLLRDAQVTPECWPEVINRVQNEEDYGIVFGLRMWDTVVALTVATQYNIISSASPIQVPAWQIWNVSYWSDPDVGISNAEEWEIGEDESPYLFLNDALIAATVSCITAHMNNILENRAEAQAEDDVFGDEIIPAITPPCPVCGANTIWDDENGVWGCAGICANGPVPAQTRTCPAGHSLYQVGECTGCLDPFCEHEAEPLRQAEGEEFERLFKSATPVVEIA